MTRSFFNGGSRLLFDPAADHLAGMGGASQGSGSELPESGITQAGDTPPVNGGPPREDLTSATIEDGSGVALGANGGTGGLAGSPSPADPNNAAWTGVREAARARGFEFDGSVTDDASALDYLMRQAQANRQADYYAQLGRQLAPQAPAIQQYLQQQRAPQQPERPAWQAPEFDQRWAQLVEPSAVPGVYVGKPGTPQGIVDKVNEYAAWKAKFDQNPGEMINQAAEARAKEIARSEFKSQFQQYQQQTAIQQIMQQNAQFLYQVDQSGQVARDFQGRPMLSPVGTRYMHHLQVAQQYGILNPVHQDQFAKNAVRGEYAMAAQAQAAAAGAKNPQAQQAQHRPNINPSGAAPSLQRSQNPQAHNEPDESGIPLRERLMRALRENGVSDADIAASAGVE